ncbi:MAG: hypothetical protein EBW32_04470 [Rhodobacteraceae bacterium]|nr:hypothetical protein [Paracoccaceae bacterium]
MKKPYDILIIGAGLNGAAMALGAAQFGLSVALFDAHKMSDQLETGFDGRSYALSLTSVRMMRSLGLWDSFCILITTKLKKARWVIWCRTDTCALCFKRPSIKMTRSTISPM